MNINVRSVDIVYVIAQSALYVVLVGCLFSLAGMLWAML